MGSKLFQVMDHLDFHTLIQTGPKFAFHIFNHPVSKIQQGFRASKIKIKNNSNVTRFKDVNLGLFLRKFKSRIEHTVQHVN